MSAFAKQLEDLIRDAAVAAAMLDTDMRYLAWSKRWVEDYQLGTQDLLGRSHYDVFPEISPEWKAVHRRGLAGETMSGNAEPFFRSDGRSDIVSWSVQPWYNERSQVGGVIIFSESVTQQRRFEEALMASERRLSTIFKESPVALAVSDFETGRLLDLNDALLDCVRSTSRDQMIGRTSIEVGILSRQDRDRMMDAISAGPGRVEGFLTKMHRLNGESFDAELYISSYWEGGKRLLLTSVVDVTRRKRAEEELAASRAHYRALFEAANDAVFLSTVQPDGSSGTFVAVNHVAVEMLGFSQEEFQRMTPADIDAGPFSEERQRAFRALARDGKITFEIVHVAKNGRLIPVEVSARRFDLGDKPFILGIVRDITARKQAQEEIARLAKAIEQAVETVVITDAEGRIVYANAAFEKSSGYSVAEALGKNPRFLKSGKQDAAFYQQMWEVLGRGETWRGRLQNKRKDGTLYQEEASISPVRDEWGRVVNYIALKLDVTREAELQAQLVQAQKMESIGRLAGGVAHDFNNLLTIINGYSKLAIAELKIGDPLREKLDEISKAGERAAGLTRQLLAFSRKQILQPCVLDLNIVVQDMRSMLERIMGEDVEVDFAFSAEAPTVHADPHQLEQVIMNLAVNARDAMPDGGRLTVRTTVTERDGNCASVHPQAGPGYCAVLTVSDTGVGMSEATRQQIFEPFFTTKGPGKGTGLGLSIVQGVIAQSGGCIRTFSEPGLGTTFEICLPLSADTVPEGEKAAPVTVVSGHETILVVEDQEKVRSFTVDALKAYGYRVMEAANAGAALAICARKTSLVDLVLSDVVMPHTNGHELAAQLSHLRPELKVVLMSGYPNDAIPVCGGRNASSHFLMKPFSPQELASKVRQVLRRELRRARILVADDEDGVRFYLRKVLESSNYEVREASDGRQAIHDARSEPIDLVITDLVMPEQEGIETIQVLRKEAPHIRIIATSGAFNGQFLGVAKLLGADAILSKPISSQALLEKVAELLVGRTPVD